MFENTKGDPLADDEDDDWEIEGRVRLEPADYLHAWFYVPGFRVIWQYLLFVPFSFVLIALGSPRPWRHWLVDAHWTVAALALSVLGAWAFRQYWATASFARVGPRQISYCFDPEGLQVDSSFGKQRYAWDQLMTSVATPRAFLVFLNRAQFLLVPRRTFTATEVAEVAELLATLPSRRAAGRRRLLRLASVWLLACALTTFALLKILRLY